MHAKRIIHASCVQSSSHVTAHSAGVAQRWNRARALSWLGKELGGFVHASLPLAEGPIARCRFGLPLYLLIAVSRAHRGSFCYKPMLRVNFRTVSIYVYLDQRIL